MTIIVESFWPKFELNSWPRNYDNAQC